MGIFSFLFHRHKSAYRTTYSSIVSALKRDGVRVGGTSAYPRVEVYGITEGERMDKSGSLRSIEFHVDSVSNTSLDEAIALNEDNLVLLADLNLGDAWEVIDIIPVSLTDETSTIDTSTVIYRLSQNFRIYVQTKTSIR